VLQPLTDPFWTEFDVDEGIAAHLRACHNIVGKQRTVRRKGSDGQCQHRKCNLTISLATSLQRTACEYKNLQTDGGGGGQYLGSFLRARATVWTSLNW
jgi:hypothetical protein